MVYLGLMRGAAGIQFYCHSQQASGGAQYSPAAWSAVRILALEVAELAPSLSLGENLSALVTVTSTVVGGASGGGNNNSVYHAAWQEPPPDGSRSVPKSQLTD
jgi:hypothetical protein